MSSRNLPPVRHLPQWTRVGRLGKSCSPRHLPTSQPQQLPVVPPATRATEAGPEPGPGPGASGHGDVDPRNASVQKNIQFLQQQHKDTLEKLHTEIEYLRRENKELQYKMIMEPQKSSGKGNSIGEGSDIVGSARPDHSPDMKGGLLTSLQPLRIHSHPSHPPRAPTLQECEVIIRQLYNANSLQSQETKSHLGPLSFCIFPFPRSGPSHSGVVLPALKQSLSSTIAERQRRTRAVQRDRFKRTVQ
uniref:Si:ch211-222n4.2 n=1 Tax=Cyclopterus lumpus TaxID=8103 RepID=A0A8C3AUR8_CYCLU